MKVAPVQEARCYQQLTALMLAMVLAPVLLAANTGVASTSATNN